MRIRRGGGDTALPVPSFIYGPTEGDDAIRLGAGARTVTDPGGGISFNSSGSLQSAINANPVGSVFVCSVNNPVWNGQVDTGTKAPTVIFPGAVGQVVIEGNGGQFFPMALGPDATLKGGTWQNFGTASTVHGIRMYGDNSTVEDAVVSGMYDTGIAPVGNGCTISHCVMHDNGMGGYGGSTGDNITMEYCDIYGNNTRLVNPGNEGGAGKIVTSAGGWFHHNYAHDNAGFGIWWDTDCSALLIEENVSENNQRAGLFFEANYGSVIRRNYIADNGRDITIGGQSATFENCVNARLADCNATRGDGSPVAFSRNILDYTLAQNGRVGGLLLMWDHNATVSRSCQNNDAFENQFWLRGTLDQRVGGQDTATSAYPVWSSDNHFYSNEYRVASTSVSYWKWDTGTGGGVAKNFTAWQGYHPTGETRIQI